MRIIQGVFGFGAQRDYTVDKDASAGDFVVKNADGKVVRRFDNQMEANAWASKKKGRAGLKRKLVYGAGGAAALGAGATALGAGALGLNLWKNRPSEVRRKRIEKLENELLPPEQKIAREELKRRGIQN